MGTCVQERPPIPKAELMVHVVLALAPGGMADALPVSCARTTRTRSHSRSVCGSARDSQTAGAVTGWQTRSP